MCYNPTAWQLLEHSKAVTSVLLDHFEALKLVLSLSILFLYLLCCKKHMKSPQLHHSPVSVLYYKCQEGNLKFIKDTTQSQDVKIGLCYTGMNHRKPHHIALGSVTFTTREKRSWSHQWQVSEIIRSVCSNSWSKTTKQWAMLGRILRWKQVLYKILGHPYLAYGV